MTKAGNVLIGFAAVAMILAMSIKFTITGRLVPGALPINWAKIADTLLLFSIAISLVRMNKK